MTMGMDARRLQGSALAAGLLVSLSVSAVTDAQRRLAVQEVLRGPTCSYVSANNPDNFYWEIGDANGMVYGSHYASHRTTAVDIASASKWLFGAYYVQKHGLPTGYDLYRLDQTSHIQVTNQQAMFSGGAFVIRCSSRGSVKQCANTFTTNPAGDPTQKGFSYDDGHFVSLSADDPVLAADLQSELGDDISVGLLMPKGTFTYWMPSVAGGGNTTPANYATFLQMMLKGAQGSAGGLLLGRHLNYGLVCSTNPSPGNPQPTAEWPKQWYAVHTPFDSEDNLCPGRGVLGGAENSPFPYEERAQYGVGHWKERDGIHSSPGAFGFYPWIDTQEGLYGLVVAAKVPVLLHPDAPAVDSMYCGRNIREAWETGVAHDPYAPYYQDY